VEKFDVAAGARAAVRAEKTHAIEKDQQIEDVGVFERGGAAALLLHLYVGNESGEGGVELAGKARVGRFLVVDAAAQGFVGFGKRLHGGENIWIGCVRLRGTELGYGKGEGGHELLLGVNDVGGQIDVQQGGLGRKGSRVLVFIAVSSEQLRAIRYAINGDFAAGAAADGADSFALSGTKTVGLALFANRTKHYGLP